MHTYTHAQQLGLAKGYRYAHNGVKSFMKEHFQLCFHDFFFKFSSFLSLKSCA